MMKHYRYYLQPLKSASTAVAASTTPTAGAAATPKSVSPKDRIKEDLAKKLTAEQKIIEAEERREAARVAREISRKEAEEQAKEKIVNSVSVPIQQQQQDSSTFANQGTWLAQAPEGVPSILSWTQRDDGTSCEVEIWVEIDVSFYRCFGEHFFDLRFKSVYGHLTCFCACLLCPFCPSLCYLTFRLT
jgi:hypothetical protein